MLSCKVSLLNQPWEQRDLVYLVYLDMKYLQSAPLIFKQWINILNR